jgi:CRISPR-associated protein Csx10
MLQSISRVKDDTLTLEMAYTSYDYISGWNSAWGLMKDVELITQKGGVYLFSTDKKDLWIESLKQLEITGIGDRIPEGFGQVQICSPFHLILREESI